MESHITIHKNSNSVQINFAHQKSVNSLDIFEIRSKFHLNPMIPLQIFSYPIKIFHLLCTDGNNNILEKCNPLFLVSELSSQFIRRGGPSSSSFSSSSPSKKNYLPGNSLPPAETSLRAKSRSLAASAHPSSRLVLLQSVDRSLIDEQSFRNSKRLRLNEIIAGYEYNVLIVNSFIYCDLNYRNFSLLDRNHSLFLDDWY